MGGNPNPADRGDLMMFRVPGQNDQPLFVRVDLHLRNEGLSSAWVSCSDIHFLAPLASSVVRAHFVGSTTPCESGREAPVFVGAEANIGRLGQDRAGVPVGGLAGQLADRGGAGNSSGGLA